MAHTRGSAALTERADEQYRQEQLRDREWEGRRASEGARGGETGVARRRAGGRRRARGSSGERDHGDSKKKPTERADMTPRRDTRRGQSGGGGGNRGLTGAQKSTLSHSEKRHANDPHCTVPAAPPDHQGTDGGAASGGAQWGSPPEGVSGEGAQVGLQVGGQGGGPEARESARDTTMARERPAESTGSRRTTVRGRAGDRGEGRVERRERRLTSSMA